MFENNLGTAQAKALPFYAEVQDGVDVFSIVVLLTNCYE